MTIPNGSQIYTPATGELNRIYTADTDYLDFLLRFKIETDDDYHELAEMFPEDE